MEAHRVSRVGPVESPNSPGTGRKILSLYRNVENPICRSNSPAALAGRLLQDEVGPVIAYPDAAVLGEFDSHHAGLLAAGGLVFVAEDGAPPLAVLVLETQEGHAALIKLPGPGYLP